MANIDKYLAEIRSAIYGEEVRGSIINALEAQNYETENNTSAVEQALTDAEAAVNNATAAAETANTAAANADSSGENAVKIATDAADNANTAASSANTAADNANSAASSANSAAESANTAAETAIDAADNANSAADGVIEATNAANKAADNANEAADNANNAADHAETSIAGVDDAVSDAEAAADKALVAANHGVEDYRVEYNGSESGTEAPEDGWLDYVPQVAEGDFLWTRVTIIFMDGSEFPFYSVSKMGVTSGGISGVMSIKVYFAVSDSPDYYPTHGGATVAKLGMLVLGTAALGNSGDWTTTIPEVKEYEYLWASFTYDYSDGLTYWTEPMRLTDPNCKAQAIGTDTIDTWFEEEA